ncbi:MAG: hypothetical protein JNL50_02775 [Phycisphaerae bacterium]|nr:hypothetical protein [Phycisphaerae bacterium]
MERSIGGVIAALVIAGAVFGYKFYNKSEVATEALARAQQTCAECSMYKDNSDYIEGLCIMYHEDAFDHNYSIGGRRRSGRFDADAYYAELLENMAAHAERDGRKDIADSLIALEHKVVDGK